MPISSDDLNTLTQAIDEIAYIPIRRKYRTRLEYAITQIEEVLEQEKRSREVRTAARHAGKLIEVAG